MRECAWCWGYFPVYPSNEDADFCSGYCHDMWHRRTR